MRTASKYLSEFHNMRFANIRTAHWQKAIDLAAQKGMSKSTMTKIKAVASILSEYAFAEDIVSKTYYQTVRIPRESGKKAIQLLTILKSQSSLRTATILFQRQF